MCDCFDFLRCLIFGQGSKEENDADGDCKAILDLDSEEHESAVSKEDDVDHKDGKQESVVKHEQIQNISTADSSIVNKLIPLISENKLEDENQEYQRTISAVSSSELDAQKLKFPSSESKDEPIDAKIPMPSAQECSSLCPSPILSQEKCSFDSKELKKEIADCGPKTTHSQNLKHPSQDCLAHTHQPFDEPRHSSNTSILPNQAQSPNGAHNYSSYDPYYAYNPWTSILRSGKRWYRNEWVPYYYSDGWTYYHLPYTPLSYYDNYNYGHVGPSPYSLVPPNSYSVSNNYVTFYDDMEFSMRMIEKNEVPDVLRMPLSINKYRDYFASLLYAEDYYCESWESANMAIFSVQLDEQSFSNKSCKKEKRGYFAVNIADFYGKKPYLLSRDFVYLKPSGLEIKPFEGKVARVVVKGTLILIELGEDFLRQHVTDNKYDISFTFNKMCFGRCRQAIAAATHPSFCNYLFPDPKAKIHDLTPISMTLHDQDLDRKEIRTIYNIMSLITAPPYLIAGQLCLTPENKLSRTGMVVREAIIQIYSIFPNSRILLTSPRNSTCNLLMESLKGFVYDDDMFRANVVLDQSSINGDKYPANGVPDYDQLRVISSTFIGTSKLAEQGIRSGYFSHIFLVDASSASEPEVMVTIVNMATAKTAVVVTGSNGDSPHRLRSKIARKYGLKRSYLHRLLEMPPYSDHDPLFVSYLFDMLPSSS